MPQRTTVDRVVMAPATSSSPTRPLQIVSTSSLESQSSASPDHAFTEWLRFLRLMFFGILVFAAFVLAIYLLAQLKGYLPKVWTIPTREISTHGFETT
ncbi:hypothetical protein K504DRAFT_501141 [Pleomassaria siparia CBS 279.74]|uniref:Uncharacterized protein n=1 Tax=Pleomassaria siparia CBS 279.74 TaxID=1314801 RepID=A0A6G1KF98_9PLEO|nr:hypothetical protein K504DRAFT_501141 [Pleomassaria siparia CBS 279.74]